MESSPSPAGQLCQACGLCCNGVIFADLRLQPEDDAVRLRALGVAPPLRVKAAEVTKPVKINQPCPAFNGVCHIYAERPCHCRNFECLLLKNAQDGKIETAEALRIIATARRRAEKVRKLLRALGNTDEHLPLSKRFRRVQRRLESGPVDEETADTYGDLTIAVHELNFLLADAFYPGQ